MSKFRNERLACVSETGQKTALVADVNIEHPAYQPSNAADLRPLVTGRRRPRLSDGIKHPVTVRRVES